MGGDKSDPADGPTDNATDGPTDSDKDDDVAVPNTSAGTDRTRTPNTGATTKGDKDEASFTSYFLPVAMITVISILFYVAGRKYLSHRRINF